jgi:hypothetical protein
VLDDKKREDGGLFSCYEASGVTRQGFDNAASFPPRDIMYRDNTRNRTPYQGIFRNGWRT